MRLNTLEIQLDALLRTPSPQVYATMVWFFAGACWSAMIDAPFEVSVRGMRILGPFLGIPARASPWGNAQPSPPASFVFRLSKVSVVGRDGKPVMDGAGAPVTRDVNVIFSTEAILRAFRQKTTRFEVYLTSITGGRVTLDLSSLAVQLGYLGPAPGLPPGGGPAKHQLLRAAAADAAPLRDYLNVLVFDTFAEAEAFLAWASGSSRCNTSGGGREYHEEVVKSAN